MGLRRKLKQKLHLEPKPIIQQTAQAPAEPTTPLPSPSSSTFFTAQPIAEEPVTVEPIPEVARKHVLRKPIPQPVDRTPPSPALLPTPAVLFCMFLSTVVTVCVCKLLLGDIRSKNKGAMSSVFVLFLYVGSLWGFTAKAKEWFAVGKVRDVVDE